MYKVYRDLRLKSKNRKEFCKVSVDDRSWADVDSRGGVPSWEIGWSNVKPIMLHGDQWEYVRRCSCRALWTNAWK